MTPNSVESTHLWSLRPLASGWPRNAWRTVWSSGFLSLSIQSLIAVHMYTVTRTHRLNQSVVQVQFRSSGLLCPWSSDDGSTSDDGPQARLEVGWSTLQLSP
ncbi:hypothetical protein BV25DRAFT_980621 [Artomyces pyxidatus]|uniref:Uncharacterized protein n=1 Tax=Artomyces pyxidatus TaxID=48021 RepID=A0ACB8SV74_9AGAM|nr:hypothetical protein BV25DRAFT_980621 [Artomyces pyxidatus]